MARTVFDAEAYDKVEYALEIEIARKWFSYVVELSDDTYVQFLDDYSGYTLVGYLVGHENY